MSQDSIQSTGSTICPSNEVLEDPDPDPNLSPNTRKTRRRPPPIITSLDLNNYKILENSNSSEKNAKNDVPLRRPATPAPGATGRIILVDQNTPQIPPINSSTMSFSQIAHTLTLRRNSLLRGGTSGKSKRWKMTRRDDRQFL